MLKLINSMNVKVMGTCILLQTCTNVVFSRSPLFSYLTQLLAVSGPVIWFQVLSRSSNSVFLTWQKPSEEDCNGVLLGYELGFQTGNNYNFYIYMNSTLPGCVRFL